MTNYNVTAELDIPDTNERAGHAVTALADYHPAASPSPFGRLEVIITVPADGLRQALLTGHAIITQALPQWPVVAIEVLTTDDFDRRNGITPVPALVSVPEAADLLGVTRQRVLQMLAEGKIPHTRAGRAIVIPRSALP